MKEYKGTVDVRLYDHENKYPTINKTFDSLNIGETMNILNDHDFTRMFKLKLGTDFPNQFEWKFIKEGPEVWEAEVTKIK